MNRKPYPKYLNSNVQWIGQVPEHWEVKRLKMAAHLKERKIEADEENPVPYIGMENIESWTGKLLPVDPEKNPSGVANQFTARNTLFGKLRPYLAKACNPIFDGLCSTELLVLESEQIDRRALLYWLLADGFIKLVDSSTYGSKMPRANWDFIGNCLTPVPPLPEQCAIADFLDRETGRIDALMAKKRELMALLKEKRSALITRTVTRGLPADASREFGLEPHTRYKYSGIQWLGQVPDEWEVKRGRFVMWVNPPAPLLRNLEKDREVSFVPMDSINEYGGIRHEQTRVKAEVGGGYTEFQNGDVVIAKITPCFENGKGTIANGLVNSAAYGTTELHVLRASHTIEIRFLFYLTITDGYRKLGESEMYGAGGQKRVPPEFCKDFLTPIPPLPEQAAIAAYLDRETARIDRLVEKIESVVERLQEYRTALITAVVTGKIDVRRTA